MRFKWFALFSILFVLTSCNKGSKQEAASSGSLEESLKSGKQLASQGDVVIHEGFLKLIENINPAIGAQLKDPTGKKRMVDNLIEQEQLYKESVNRGITKLPKYQEKAALYQRVIFAQALLEEETDNQAKKYYEENKDEFKGIKLAHILIRVKPSNPKDANPEAAKKEADAALEKAKAAKKKLDEGGSWQVVVEEFSEDPMSKERAGEIGKLSKNDKRVERLGWTEIVDKAYTMKAGEVSDIMKANDGYHIVKLLEEASVAPYSDVENQIKFKIRGEVKEQLMAKIVGDKKIEYIDETLKAAASAPSAPQLPPGMPLPAKQPEAKPSEEKKSETPPAQAPEKPQPAAGKTEQKPE